MRFSPLHKIYNKVGGEKFLDERKNPVNLNGATSIGNYVYVTNNHYIGRIKVIDGNAEKPAAYYDYSEADDMEKVKEETPLGDVILRPSKNKQQEFLFFNYETEQWQDNMPYATLLRKNIRRLKQPFTLWRKYCLKVNKQAMIDEMVKLFGKGNTSIRHYYVVIAPNSHTKTIECILCKKSLRHNATDYEGTFNVPMHLYKIDNEVDIDYPPVALCAMYFTRILETFHEYDIVDLNYEQETKSVTIKGVNPRNHQKPDIRFVLGKWTVKKEK